MTWNEFKAAVDKAIAEQEAGADTPSPADGEIELLYIDVSTDIDDRVESLVVGIQNDRLWIT